MLIFVGKRLGQSPSCEHWNSTKCKALFSFEWVILPLFLLRYRHQKRAHFYQRGAILSGRHSRWGYVAPNCPFASATVFEVLGSEKFNWFGVQLDVSNFTKGSAANRICRHLLYIYLLKICTLPSLASLFWLLYKMQLSFRQEFGSKVFTGGWKFVSFIVIDLLQQSRDLQWMSICGS